MVKLTKEAFFKAIQMISEGYETTGYDDRYIVVTDRDMGLEESDIATYAIDTREVYELLFDKKWVD